MRCCVVCGVCGVCGGGCVFYVCGEECGNGLDLEASGTGRARRDAI